MTAPIRNPKPEPAPVPEKRAPILKETWTQWVALTTTVLAVCAAISALKGGGYSTRVQLATTQESNHWSYYQAKSIKQHTVETQKDFLELYRLEVRTPEAQKAADEKLARARAEIARYEGEKARIIAEAQALKREEEQNKKHGASFGLAVMLLQIAIMLSSVGALLKRPAMWGIGLVFGASGLVYMANGFWLWF